MSRIMIIALVMSILTSSLFANKIKEAFDLQIKKEFLQKTITKDILEKSVFSEFRKISGVSSENFEKLLKYSVNKDMDLLEAIFILYDKNSFKRKNVEIYDPTIGKKIKKEISLPEYQKILTLLLKSSNKGNLLASFKGVSVITSRILLMDRYGTRSNNQVKALISSFMPPFLSKLRKNSICYGFVLSSEYYHYKNEYSLEVSGKEEKYKFILNKGYSLCKDQFEKKKIPKYLLREISMKRAESRAYDKIVRKRKLKLESEDLYNEKKQKEAEAETMQMIIDRDINSKGKK